MATTQRILTVDADGHVFEPRDTWQKYIEPQEGRKNNAPIQR